MARPGAKREMGGGAENTKRMQSENSGAVARPNAPGVFCVVVRGEVNFNIMEINLVLYDYTCHNDIKANEHRRYGNRYWLDYSY